MSKRRMINPDLIESDKFLKIKTEAKMFYVYLLVNADDDGFVNNPLSIAVKVNIDPRVITDLARKKQILRYKSGVISIVHWRLHNHIRHDRYTPSIYETEKALTWIKSNGEYSLKKSDGATNLLNIKI